MFLIGIEVSDKANSMLNKLKAYANNNTLKYSHHYSWNVWLHNQYNVKLIHQQYYTQMFLLITVVIGRLDSNSEHWDVAPDWLELPVYSTLTNHELRNSWVWNCNGV